MIITPDTSAFIPIPPISPFDDLAADYDRSFTHTPLGRMMREAAWRRIDARFAAGDHVLELNCGTGEDAIHLAQRDVHVLATDASMAMVQVARDKVNRIGVQNRVTVHTLAIEEIVGSFQDLEGERPKYARSRFDGVLSNFGGLNCVSDWRMVSAGLAGCVRKGGFALLCLMGPRCAWEWGWFLRQGEFQKAFRRRQPEGTYWRGMTIRYPSVTRMRRAFASEFRLVRVSAIGALLPPTYAAEWAARNPRILARLNIWERRLERLWPLVACADHYLLELERR